MTKKIKKSVSILLALVMLCGVLAVAPVTVGAEEELPERTTYNGGALDSNGNPIIGKYTFDPDTGELQLISGRFTGMAWQYEDNRGNLIWRTDNNFTRGGVKSITVEKDADVRFTENCSHMFRKFSACIKIDLSNVVTENLTNMWNMFYQCEALTYIDVSSFDTSNVTAIRNMFRDCRQLETLDLSSFKTGSVKNGNMPNTNLDASENVFDGCSKLRSLKISDKFNLGIQEKMKLNNGKPTNKGWITSDSEDGKIVSGGTTSDIAVITDPYLPVTDSGNPDVNITKTYIWFADSANYTFDENTGVLHLKSGFFNGNTFQSTTNNEGNMVTKWTANQEKSDDPNDPKYYKYIASADMVESITVAPDVKFTGDCTRMFGGFYNCTSINNLSSVDTSNVTSMWGMFDGCKSMTKIDVSRFKTSKVTAIRAMFYNCKALTELDFSSFNTGSVINGNVTGTNLDASAVVFAGCTNLRSLTISDEFNIGIQGKMELNNGENNTGGWRIVGDPKAEKVSGDGNVAVITNPEYLPTQEGETKTYKWIGYFDVDWKNWDGTKLVKTEEYKAETNIHPTYKGVTPTRPDSDGKTYTFAGWIDDLGVEYGVNDELPVVTRDTTYTAKFTEVPKKFFAAHSLTLDGDIGVNFFIDVTAAGITPQDILSGDSTLTLDFSWDTDPAPITDVSKDSITLSKSNASRYYNEDNGYFKIKCNVAAAEMACKIKADGIVAGAKDYTESETYSVRDYGMSVINNPSKYSETLVDLAKKMLDYGAKAQKVFNIIPDDLANKDVTGYTMTNVTASDIQAAIEAEPANKEKTASDMASGTSDFGLRYASSTVVYLTKSTLRHYYYIDDQGKYDNVKAKFNERKLPVAVYIEYSDIAAADLDKLQTFAIDSTHTYYYSALNYAKDVIGSNSSKDENKKLAMAMYWYNQAANAYFK